MGLRALLWYQRPTGYKHAVSTFAVALVGALSGIFLLPAHGFADDISVTQELHVTAKVLPMRHIIVDRTGNISEITSNTDEPVEPEIFELQDKPENRIHLTGSIRQQYDAVLKNVSSKKGILYQRSQVVLGAQKSSFMPLQ
jgi:hypothetical protein